MDNTVNAGYSFSLVEKTLVVWDIERGSSQSLKDENPLWEVQFRWRKIYLS